MSNYTTKAQLIGGGDIVYVDRAFVRSYAEVQAEYPDEILGTTLAFRFTNSSTLDTLNRSLIIESTSIVRILADITEMRVVEGDESSSRPLDARIDDSRILITLIHDEYDTLEILAVQPDAADAINHLHFHPTPHPSGISRVGQIRMGMSNKGNRALNSGAFLVRGEDRTSTGINRVLAKMGDNQDALDIRTRNSFRGDTKRLLMCYVSGGIVARIDSILIGGEILSTSSYIFMTLNDIHPGLSDDERLAYLFEHARDASQILHNNRANYDYIIGEESTGDDYVFNLTAGRTSPSPRFEYSYIALSAAARDIAVTTLRSASPASFSSDSVIQNGEYWGSADRLGTVYGPRYRTHYDNGDPVEATIVDFFTFKFDQRLDSLGYVNAGDPIIIPQGIFEVDFVGDDNKTVGVRPFGGDIGDLFSLETESVNYLQDTALPTSLVPGDRITQVIIVKSAIGKHGEFYGVGLRGHDTDTLLSFKYFRVRCLMKSADSTATDDVGFRRFIRTVQEALDPYAASTNATTLNSSLRALNAVGGFLRLPKPYSIPDTVDALHKLDYMTGSSSYGPLRVSPGMYAAVPNGMSIFNGIGGYHESPDLAIIKRTGRLYNIAVALKSDHGNLNTFLTCLDAALIRRDPELTHQLQSVLTSINNSPLLQNIEGAVFHSVSPEEREDVIDFLRELVHITGRSLVADNSPVTLDAANGITVHLSEQESYFSEEDVGRVFILKVPILNKKFAQSSGSLIPRLSTSLSRIRELRVRMHTWTSPRSARLVPVDDLSFYLPRTINATLSATVGYANVGYGSLRNVVVPVEHGIRSSKPYPASNLSESTQYRHVYPGSETYLDVATLFTTSLHMYSSIHYLLGTSIEVEGQQIDAFGEDKSLFLSSEAFVTFVGEGFSQAHVQDGRVELNHSNRARLTQIDKLTFLPFLRSSTQNLRVRSDDLLLLSRVATLDGAGIDWALNDIISFSPNTYHDEVSTEVGLSSIVAGQATMFNLMNGLRGVNYLNEYHIPQDGSEFTEALPPEWVRFIRNSDGDPYISQDELVLNLYDYFPKDLSIFRGAGGVRAEDAFVHKDLYAKTPDNTDPYPLNCEDLLSVDVSVSTASIGHAREISGSISPHRSRYLTSNRVIYIHSGSAPESIWNKLLSIYGPNPTHAGVLRQYVGQETINGDYTFPADVLRSQDNYGNWVLNLLDIDPALPPEIQNQRRVPLRRRSWFRLDIRELDNTPLGSVYFAFDGLGNVRDLLEYGQSGVAVSHIHGEFDANSVATGPTWEGVSWVPVQTAIADITLVTDTSDPANTVPGFALHSILKSHDLPYCPTAYIRNVSKLAPVSKELGKTLSVLAHPDAGASNISVLNKLVESAHQQKSVLISNAYPSIVQVRAGRVEKRAYDNFSGSGIDINVYDGEHSLLEGREDGVKISSLTRGYTDGLSAGDLHLRKKSALRVDSEETVFGVKVIHKGIESTQTDGAAAPEIDPELRVFGHLAFAGLLVEVTGRAWSDTGKSATSKPTSLISPFSVTRDLRVDTGIPLLSGEKIVVDGEAVGLYIPWDGAVLGSNEEASQPHDAAAVSTRVYNITRGFRNASAVFEGDINFPVGLYAPEYDIDRAALAAFGRVSIQGLLDVYGDLYTTRFHHDNFGSNRVLAGVIGHLNPTSAPRAQNTLYTTQAMSSINLHISCPNFLTGTGANYAQIQNLVSPPQNEFNQLLYPNQDVHTSDSASVPHDTYNRYNRNATGISQQQLGERNTVLRIEGLVNPRKTDLLFLAEYLQGGLIYNIDETHVPVLPTNVQIAQTILSPEDGVSDYYPHYTLRGIAYHPVSEEGRYAPHGHLGEYILLMFSRPLAMWGESYLGRTVVLNIGARGIPDIGIGNPAASYGGSSSSSSSSTSEMYGTGWVTGVITHIVDSEEAGLTFVSISPVVSRFDRWAAYSISGQGVFYTYPSSFEDVVQPFLDAGDNVISIVPDATQSSAVVSWTEWWTGNESVGFRLSNTYLSNSNVHSIRFDVRVQGREWVANTSQLLVSDRLFVCNDIGGNAEIKFYRDETLDISSPGDVTVTSGGDTQIDSHGDITLTANGRINLDNTEGIFENGVPLLSPTEVTASGYIVLAAPLVSRSTYNTLNWLHADKSPYEVSGCALFATLHHDPFTDPLTGDVHPFYLRGVPTTLENMHKTETTDPAHFANYLQETASKVTAGFIDKSVDGRGFGYFENRPPITPSAFAHGFGLYDATDLVQWFFDAAYTTLWESTNDPRNLSSDTGPYTNPGTVRLAYAGNVLPNTVVSDGVNEYEETLPPLVISCEPWHHSNDLINDGSRQWRKSDVDRYIAVMFFMSPNYLDMDPETYDASSRVDPLAFHGTRCYGFITDADTDPWEIQRALTNGELGQYTARDALPDLKIYASLYGLASSNDIKRYVGFDYGDNETGLAHVNDWRQFVHYDWAYAEELRNREYSQFPTRAQPFMDNLLGPATVEEDIKWVYEEAPDTPAMMHRYKPAVAVTKDTWTYMGPAASEFLGKDYWVEPYRTFLKCINSIRISSTAGSYQALYTNDLSMPGPKVFKYAHGGNEYVVSDVTLTSNYVGDDTDKRGHVEPVGMQAYRVATGNLGTRLWNPYAYPTEKAPLVQGMSAGLKEFPKDVLHFVDTARWFDVGRAHTKCTLDYLLSLNFSTDHSNILEYRHMAGSPLWGILNHYPSAVYPTSLNVMYPENRTMVDSVPMIVGVTSTIDTYYNSFHSQYPDPNVNVQTRGSSEYDVYYQSLNGYSTPTGLFGRYVEPPLLRREQEAWGHDVSLYGMAALSSGLRYTTLFTGGGNLGVDVYRFGVTYAIRSNVPPTYVPAYRSNFPAMVYYSFGLTDIELPFSGELVGYPDDSRSFTSVDVKYRRIFGDAPPILTHDNYVEAYSHWFTERFKINNAMLLDNPLKGSLAAYEMGKLMVGAKALYPVSKGEPAKYLSKSVEDFTDIGELRIRLDESGFQGWYESLTDRETMRETYGIEEKYYGTRSLVIPITVTLKIRRV